MGRGEGGREMGVNASILSTPSLKLFLFTAPFFLILSVTSKWDKSLVCVCVCGCFCPKGEVANIAKTWRECCCRVAEQSATANQHF